MFDLGFPSTIPPDNFSYEHRLRIDPLFGTEPKSQNYNSEEIKKETEKRWYI
jgi:hypothetical protein